MQADFKVLNRSSESYRTIERQLAEHSDQVLAILSRYKGITCIDDKRSRINSASGRLQELSGQTSQFSRALDNITDLYYKCESNISGNCNELGLDPESDSVVIKASEVISKELESLIGATGGCVIFDPSINPLFDIVKDITSQLGTTEDIFEILSKWDIPGLSEDGFIRSLFEEISSVAGDFKDNIKDNKLFKELTYMYDGIDLLKAINTGNADTIEDLVEKYVGKIGKKTIGVKGVTASVYIDLAWNFGKNFVEGFDIIDKNPGMDGVLSAMWNATGGTLIEAGGNLASDGLDLLYTLMGKDFDEKDFENCIDYMINHPWESVEATGKVLGDAAANLWEGAVNVVDTVGSWFANLF